MDPGGDSSVTVEELPNPSDVSAVHVLSPPSATTGHSAVDGSNELSGRSSPVPRTIHPAPVFEPIMDDRMDWHPSPENSHHHSPTRIPSQDPSDHPAAARERSTSPPPPDRDGDSVDSEQADGAHAFWADFEDDPSTPSEDELKEIESAQDGDFSAHEYDYWEQSFYRDPDDPEYRPVEKACLTWQFKGVRGTKDRPNRAKIMRSPPAYVGGYWWSIKFFPRGNDVSSLSIYIECSRTRPAAGKCLCQGEFKAVRGSPNAVLSDCTSDLDFKFPEAEDPAAWMHDYYEARYPTATDDASCGSSCSSSSWRVPAQIGLVLYNPKEPRTGWTQSSCHQFNPHNVDWGWTNFHGPWDSIHRRQHGQRQALLQNDTLAFDAYIRVFEDPTRSLWWHPSESEPVWESLLLTGYRPLGSAIFDHTPHVAGLASWLHLAPFCKIIQSVDVLEHLNNSDVKPKPLCDALQKFLWELRGGTDDAPEYVDPESITFVLTHAREYSSDVSELWERLRRGLELELAGTEAPEQLAKLFDSPPVDEFRNGSSEPIHTLPKLFNSRICVPADQVRSTREALEGYLSAKSGRWLLPPVLHLELDRQRLDMLARQWRLVYDRVDLDEELDLSPWVWQGQCANYVLYGYVAHRGPRRSGKFLSVLRPGGPGTMWLAFDDGDDNCVHCLTRKAALQSFVDGNAYESIDHRTGHDVPVVAMYVRSDVVHEFLPGPQIRWDASESMKKYYTLGTHLVLRAPDETTAKQLVQVEVYSLPKFNELGSLFDMYDLMSCAKKANCAMYLNLPRSTTMTELRKRIAPLVSTTDKHVCPDHVRLWQIGPAGDRLAAALAFRRISDLNANLEQPLATVRLWMEIISDEDAKYFAMSDPQVVSAPEDKREEAVAGHSDSGRSDVQSDPQRGEQVASSGAQENSNSQTRSDSSDNTAQNEARSNESDEPGPSAGVASIVTMIANDAEEMDAEGQEARGEAAVTWSIDPAAAEAEPVATRDARPWLPVDHIYYFIQIFDAENQSLRTVGSFFSRLEEDVKIALREHLGWNEDRDFLTWKRMTGPTVATLPPRATFQHVYIQDGMCFIVQDKMGNERRTELEVSGKFTNPDLLVAYLWAKSRNHPINAFTGFKIVEATFTGDYYSGDFKNGLYHGRGKHISDSASTYEGEFVFGRRHGKGVMVYPSGDTYEGDWVNDRRHGQGTFIERKTGNKYVGGYKDDKRHGKGVSYWEVADEEMDLCQICYGEEQDALFYDCGHVCACLTCAKQVDICPICRKNVIGVVRIYRT